MAFSRALTPTPPAVPFLSGIAATVAGWMTAFGGAGAFPAPVEGESAEGPRLILNFSDSDGVLLGPSAVRSGTISLDAAARSASALALSRFCWSSSYFCASAISAADAMLFQAAAEVRLSCHH